MADTISIRRLLASSTERVSCFEEKYTDDLCGFGFGMHHHLLCADRFRPVRSPATEAIEGIPVNAVQYYLREHNGKLAVFAPDSDVPELVFDVYLSTLPAYDRGQLQMGIPIYSYEELVQRIEDYIS